MNGLIKIFLNTVVFAFSFVILLMVMHFSNYFYALQSGETRIELRGDTTYFTIVEDLWESWNIDMRDQDEILWDWTGVVGDGIDYGIDFVITTFNHTILPVYKLNSINEILMQGETIDLETLNDICGNPELETSCKELQKEYDTYQRALLFKPRLEKYLNKNDEAISDDDTLRSDLPYAFTFMTASAIGAGLFLYNNRVDVYNPNSGYGINAGFGGGMPGTKSKKGMPKIRKRRKNKKNKDLFE